MVITGPEILYIEIINGNASLLNEKWEEDAKMHKRLANLKERYAPGSYFFKLFGLIGFMMMIIVVILAYVLFGTFSQYFEKSLQSNTKSILSQISYNLQYTSDYINQLLLTLANRQETAQLLYAGKFDVLTAYQNITSLDQTLVAAPFIDSVYLYNGALRQFYVVGAERYVREQADMSDREAVSWIDHPGEIKPFKPIYRHIQDRAGSAGKSVFTFVLHDSADLRSPIPRMIVINVKADWIMNHIETMSKNQFGPSSTVFIIDEANHIVEANRRPDTFEAAAKLKGSCVGSERLQGSGRDGHFSCRLDNIDYFAAYESIPNLDWKLLVLTANQTVAGKIRELKTVTLVVTGLLIIIGLLSALLAAKYLHFPIRRLKMNISAFLGEGGGIRTDSSLNEFAYVSQSLTHMQHNLTSLQSFINHHLLTLKRDMLTKLLVQPIACGQPLESLFEQLNIRLPAKGRYTVVLLKIDHLPDIKDSLTEEQWGELKDSMTFTLEQRLQGGYCCEVIRSEDEWIAILDTSDEEVSAHKQSGSLQQHLLEVQALIERQFHMSVSLFISSAGTGLPAVRSLYKDVERLSQYRLHFGKGCILTNVDLNGIKEEQMPFPTSLVKQLKEKLVNGEKEAVNRLLTEILAYFSTYSLPNIQFGIHCLFHQMVETIRTIDSNSRHSFDIDLTLINRKLTECETLDDAVLLFRQLFASAIGKMSKRKEDKLTHCVGQMKAYIDDHLLDFTLSSDQIASRFQLSTDYVRKLFKKEMSVSMAAYINQERIKRLAEQLLMTEETIDALLDSMGWDNKNYFYKLFKAHFGVTPTEFREARSEAGRHVGKLGALPAEKPLFEETAEIYSLPQQSASEIMGSK
jgi:YesN/AraC family two-component response regulator